MVNSRLYNQIFGFLSNGVVLEGQTHENILLLWSNDSKFFIQVLPIFCL